MKISIAVDGAKAFIITDITLCLLYIIVSILLLFVAFENNNANPKLLLPWLVTVTLSSITRLVLCVVLGIRMNFNNDNQGVLIIVSGLISFGT